MTLNLPFVFAASTDTPVPLAQTFVDGVERAGGGDLDGRAALRAGGVEVGERGRGGGSRD